MEPGSEGLCCHWLLIFLCHCKPLVFILVGQGFPVDVEEDWRLLLVIFKSTSLRPKDLVLLVPVLGASGLDLVVVRAAISGSGDAQRLCVALNHMPNLISLVCVLSLFFSLSLSLDLSLSPSPSIP